MPQREGDLAKFDAALGTTPNWVIGAIGCALVIVAALYTLDGARLQSQAKTLVDQENASVCAKLGFERSSARFADCAAALDEVRANELRRREQSIL